MNDVLPKPFTKEGLLSMLEKHLSHLKRPLPGMETVSASSNNGSLLPPPHQSARQSLKDENSPGASPATVSTNWNSPMQPSPVASGLPPDEYIQSVRHPVPYGGLDGGGAGPGSYGPAATASMGLPRQGGLHRRGISDISGGEELKGDAKRQMYVPVPPMQGGRY